MRILKIEAVILFSTNHQLPQPGLIQHRFHVVSHRLVSDHMTCRVTQASKSQTELFNCETRWNLLLELNKTQDKVQHYSSHGSGVLATEDQLAGVRRKAARTQSYDCVLLIVISVCMEHCYYAGGTWHVIVVAYSQQLSFVNSTSLCAFINTTGNTTVADLGVHLYLFTIGVPVALIKSSVAQPQDSSVTSFVRCGNTKTTMLVYKYCNRNTTCSKPLLLLHNIFLFSHTTMETSQCMKYTQVTRTPGLNTMQLTAITNTLGPASA